MARSVAIIGAGQIGYAAAYQFAFHDWDVRIYARSAPAWELGKNERFQEYLVGDSVAPDAELVLDTIAYDQDDVARYDPDTIGRLIVISSASVYCDEQGRTLDEAARNGFPVFHEPVGEDHSTVAPGPATYSTRKVRMEMKAREMFGERVTIIRPGAIYGKYSRHPREWWFVKRMLDGRKAIPLGFGGKSRFATTCATDIAKFAKEAFKFGWGGIFNLASDDLETVEQIGCHISSIMGTTAEFIGLDGPPKGKVGRTPWSIPKPFPISTAKAHALEGGLGEALGFGLPYGPVAAVEWLAKLNPADWRAAFPQLAAYPWDMFDYEAEDRFLASL